MAKWAEQGYFTARQRTTDRPRHATCANPHPLSGGQPAARSLDALNRAWISAGASPANTSCTFGPLSVPARLAEVHPYERPLSGPGDAVGDKT